MNILLEKYKQILDVTCSKKDSTTYFLKITASHNEKGIIYKVTAVLFAHGWNIEEAVIETIDGKFVEDVFVIRNLLNQAMSDTMLNQIKTDLYSLFKVEISIEDYIKNSGKDVKVFKKPYISTVHLFNPPSIEFTVLDIRTIDRPGLLYEIAQVLFQSDIDIISITAKTDDGLIRDSFLLCTQDRVRLTEMECDGLKQKIETILL